MNTFKAQGLADFYQKVADGGEIEFRVNSTAKGWYRSGFSPNLSSVRQDWRIKPTKKVIDLSVLIESGIDCEFSDANEAGIFISKVIKQGKRISLALPEYRYYDVDGDTWNRCQPRMNHKHAWQGGECPLPEGFMVKVWFRSGGDTTVTTPSRLYWGANSETMAFEVLGLADGYVMPYDKEVSQDDS